MYFSISVPLMPQASSPSPNVHFFFSSYWSAFLGSVKWIFFSFCLSACKIMKLKLMRQVIMKLSLQLRIVCICILLGYKKVRINRTFYSGKLSMLILADSVCQFNASVVVCFCMFVLPPPPLFFSTFLYRVHKINILSFPMSLTLKGHSLKKLWV